MGVYYCYYDIYSLRGSTNIQLVSLQVQLNIKYVIIGIGLLLGRHGMPRAGGVTSTTTVLYICNSILQRV